MFKPLIAGALLLASISAVQAAECEFPFDATIASFASEGATPYIIPADKLPEVVAGLEAADGIELGDVTRGFLVSAGGSILLGLEVDDCLLPPFKVGTVAAPARLSGKDPKTGQIGA